MTGAQAKWALGLMSAVQLALACTGEVLIVGESDFRRSDSDAQLESLEELTCGDLIAERVGDPECWPTRHAGSWRGFVTDNPYYLHLDAEPREFPRGDIALTIEANGAGRIVFETRMGAAPAAPACEGALPARSPSAGHRLLEGHPYRLLDLATSGGTANARHGDPNLTFALSFAEPWDCWCRAQASPDAPSNQPLAEPEASPPPEPCACDDAGCFANPIRQQISLNLSSDGNAMWGTLSRGSRSAAPASRLEFLREPAP